MYLFSKYFHIKYNKFISFKFFGHFCRILYYWAHKKMDFKFLNLRNQAKLLYNYKWPSVCQLRLGGNVILYAAN